MCLDHLVYQLHFLQYLLTSYISSENTFYFCQNTELAVACAYIACSIKCLVEEFIHL